MTVPILGDLDTLSIALDTISRKSSRMTIRSGKSITAKTVSTKSKIVEENKTLSVNPDCFVQILLDYVISEVQFNKDCEFDFCDLNGDFIGILGLKPWESAMKIMVPFKTYVIVLIERNQSGQYKNFDIQLNKNTELYMEMAKKLKKYLQDNSSREIIHQKRSSIKRLSINLNKSPTRQRSSSIGSKSQV